MTDTKQKTSGPVAIRTKYPTDCKQTGAHIEKGALCVWYPETDSTYHMKSPQGQIFLDTRGKAATGNV